MLKDNHNEATLTDTLIFVFDKTSECESRVPMRLRPKLHLLLCSVSMTMISSYSSAYLGRVSCADEVSEVQIVIEFGFYRLPQGRATPIKNIAYWHIKS